MGVLRGELFLLLWLAASIVSCQLPPTKIMESDAQMESRAFAKIQFGEKIDFKNSVIIDTRSRFEYEMAKLPRSFNAYWKDWDLRGYKNKNLEEKIKELQRLLALKGIDPLSQVVILGKGLKGSGEEFLMASTLIVLGVTKINFINEFQIKEATQAKKLPPIENIPSWERPATMSFECTKENTTDKSSTADIIINKSGQNGSFKAEALFDKTLKVMDQSFPKSINLKIVSENSFWSYGLALYFMEQGRNPCVL